jgi:putative ABC transport system permease protein
MTSFRLALANLNHARGRAAVSIIGTAFAVVLIFMQLGFLGATSNTATLLYERLNFDVILISSEYLDLSRPANFDRSRLAQARSAAGVDHVMPFSTAQGLWRNPTQGTPQSGQRWAIVMLGVNPADIENVFLPADRGVFENTLDRQQAAKRLMQTNAVLMDSKSSEDFGDIDELRKSPSPAYNGQIVEFVGSFELGSGFSYKGLLMASEETFASLNMRSANTVTFGLITLKPGTNADETVRQLNSTLPRDVRALTRKELADQERNYWMEKTAVGKLFYFGVMLSLLVGAIFVYQMMVADIKKRLPEYATLKAMGYSFRYLFFVVVWQALFLAIGGYIGAFLASCALYEITVILKPLPMWMTLERAVSVFALTTSMCVGSGLIAVRKVQTADPADLF